MSAWIKTQKDGYDKLDAVFTKYDENGDGMLSLKEFTGVYHTTTESTLRWIVMTRDKIGA